MLSGSSQMTQEELVEPGSDFRFDKRLNLESEGQMGVFIRASGSINRCDLKGSHTQHVHRCGPGIFP